MKTVFCVVVVVFTAFLTAQAQPTESETIKIAPGSAVAIDGQIEEKEWQDALSFDLAGGGRVFFKHDGDYFYVGLRGVKNGWGQIYLSEGESSDVYVLHASAALGMSVYRLGKNRLWQPANEFVWDLRDSAITSETQKKRADYLKNNFWVANNIHMTDKNEFEFQLKPRNPTTKQFRVAVEYLAGDEKQFFPASLADDSLNVKLASGSTPPDLRFNHRQWAQISLEKEGKPVVSRDAAINKSPNSEVVEQLKQATQELLDGIAPGNRAVWEKYLAEGSIYADEEGRVLTKDELLKELTPLPKGYIGSIKIGETKALAQDNVVVLSHLDREDLEFYGQKIVTYFQMTNTWARQSNGQWKLVGTHVMAIPNERKPAKIDPNTLALYVGQYQLAPDVIYTVTRERDQLFGQRTGRAKEELLPLCEDIFYTKGAWRGEKVFETDSSGKVIRLLDRRENNDLVWKKMK